MSCKFVVTGAGSDSVVSVCVLFMPPSRHWSSVNVECTYATFELVALQI